MTKLFCRMPTAGLFGVVAATGTIYGCEWKEVLQYLPWYSTKYELDAKVPK